MAQDPYTCTGLGCQEQFEKYSNGDPCFLANEDLKKRVKKEYLDTACYQRTFDNLADAGFATGFADYTPHPGNELEYIYGKWQAVGAEGAKFKAVNREYYQDFLSGYEYLELRGPEDILAGTTADVKPVEFDVGQYYLGGSNPRHGRFAIYGHKMFEDGRELTLEVAACIPFNSNWNIASEVPTEENNECIAVHFTYNPNDSRVPTQMADPFSDEPEKPPVQRVFIIYERVIESQVAENLPSGN